MQTAPGIDWTTMTPEDFNAALPGTAVRRKPAPVLAREHVNGTAALFGEDAPPPPPAPTRRGTRRPGDADGQNDLL
ncbi:hypothetical protein [Streptomyces niveus]|uniref:hypothetical protein n=1 Tax=Streptomyces niveus TaxID=193462 RepID=UPI0034331DD3